MAVWFSTVHQLAMVRERPPREWAVRSNVSWTSANSRLNRVGKTATYMVQDLCLHDEYIEPLRQELRDYLVLQAKPGALIDVERLPLLDSFIKESIRCTNADASK